MKKNILVTGGAGFIGSSLVERLIQNANNNVVVVDNLLTGKKENIPQGKHKNLRFIRCNVNDFMELSGVFYATNFDFVFHYAAVVGVRRTLEHPLSVLSDIDGLKNVAELCKSTGVQRLFYASSSEVYGEPVEIPQNERTTPLNSKLPYAIVKNLGEAFFKSYHKEYGLEYTIFRFFNTYGPRQSSDFVISRFIRQAMAGDPLIIHGDGSQTRTFCYIDDNLECSIACMEQDAYVNDVINIGSDKECSILELARLCIDACHSNSRITHVPPLEEGDMQRRCADNSKMKALISKKLLPIEEGVNRIIAHPLWQK